MRIEITETHKRMLKRLQIEWRDDPYDAGDLRINQKRPYGNSDILQDIAECAGIKALDYERNECYTKDEIAQMRQLHQDIATILKQLIADACK